MSERVWRIKRRRWECCVGVSCFVASDGPGEIERPDWDGFTTSDGARRSWTGEVRDRCFPCRVVAVSRSFDGGQSDGSCRAAKRAMRDGNAGTRDGGRTKRKIDKGRFFPDSVSLVPFPCVSPPCKLQPAGERVGVSKRKRGRRMATKRGW